MTWATGVQDAPRIRTYADAVAHEAAVKPIRGRDKQCKPLGRRDTPGLEIVREQVPEGSRRKPEIYIRLYSQTYITYRPNGCFDLKLPVYGDATASKLILNLLGVAVLTRNGRNWVRACPVAGPLADTMGYYPMNTAQEKAKRPGTSYQRTFSTATLVPHPYPAPNPYPAPTRYKMLQIKHPHRRKLNRLGAAAVRNRYADFSKLLSGCIKMRTILLPDSGDSVYHKQRTAALLLPAEYMAGIRSKNVTRQMEVAQYFVDQGLEGKYVYNRQPGAGQYSTTYTYTQTINADKVRKAFLRIIYSHHYKEAFETVIVTDGSITPREHPLYIGK